MEQKEVRLNKDGPNMLASQPLLSFRAKEDKENLKRTSCGGGGTN